MCRRSGGQALAGIRAAVATAGAGLAMFRRVTRTFFAAGAADTCTYPAGRRRFVALQAHQLSAGAAEGDAFHVELYAAGHHLDVRFAGAGRCAAVADIDAFQAGGNAGLVIRVLIHNGGFFPGHAAATRRFFIDSLLTVILTVTPIPTGPAGHLFARRPFFPVAASPQNVNVSGKCKRFRTWFCGFFRSPGGIIVAPALFCFSIMIR